MKDKAEGEAMPDLDAWVIAQVGDCSGVVFHAEIDIPGWTGRPWVRARALTDHEALERESIGVRDAYLLGGDGGVACERTYDLAAMADYDFVHSVVDFCLPERGADGEVVAVRGEEADAKARVEMARRLPLALGEWVRECVDRVNLRRPSDQTGLDTAQKN